MAAHNQTSVAMRTSRADFAFLDDGDTEATFEKIIGGADAYRSTAYDHNTRRCRHRLHQFDACAMGCIEVEQADAGFLRRIQADEVRDFATLRDLLINCRISIGGRSNGDACAVNWEVGSLRAFDKRSGLGRDTENVLIAACAFFQIADERNHT